MEVPYGFPFFPPLVARKLLRAFAIAILVLIIAVSAGAQSASILSTGFPKSQLQSELEQWRDSWKVNGHARFDYFSASKHLDNNHNLLGFTLQPKATTRFGSWGDAKIEGRVIDQDITSAHESLQGRLLESYGNLYFGSLDIRVGKQNIPWGRADAYNPTDVLTPQDYRVLSAHYEADKRTGTAGVRANYTLGSTTLQFIWLPMFNPSAIPIPPIPGLREQKASRGDWSDQGFALKWDHTSSSLDWSLSFYHGRNLLPQARPNGSTELVLFHNQINMIGADFATTLGQYGIRGEAAFIQTADTSGTDPLLVNPSFTYVLGVDRSLTEDVDINVQAYQRYIVNFRNPFDVQSGLLQNLAILNATVNQQLDQFQGGFTGRLKATWWNKTLETELLGVLNLPRGDFYLRPIVGYAFNDVWKGYIGGDIFNGQDTSFFGRIQNASAVFVELRTSI